MTEIGRTTGPSSSRSFVMQCRPWPTGARWGGEPNSTSAWNPLGHSATTRLKSCVDIRGIALKGERRDCRKVAGMLAMVGHDGRQSGGGAGSENPGVGGSVPSQPPIHFTQLATIEYLPTRL